jgi:hypothetical protein
MLLSATLGQPVRVERFERLAPWAVARCRVVQGDGSARSVIVKWLRENSQGFRTDLRQLATERAALEFLAAIGWTRAPRLVAADHEAGVLVMQDLAPRSPLDGRLRVEGLAAMSAEMLDYARALGELGAASVGHAARFDALRAAYGPLDPAACGERGVGPDWPAAAARLADLGLAIPGGVERELATLLGVLEAPGPFLALTNGDTQVNNFLVGQGEGKLIDYEAAGFRHALTAAALIHTPGSAWITVNGPHCADLEGAYRTTLSSGIPEAEDDQRFGLGMAAACLAYALDRLSRFSLVDGRPPGDASRVQLVSTLESAALAARGHRAFPAVSGWAERAAAWLRRRWPDADVDLGAYPPYTPRA